jgi:hypothetical protein
MDRMVQRMKARGIEITRAQFLGAGMHGEVPGASFCIPGVANRVLLLRLLRKSLITCTVAVYWRVQRVYAYSPRMKSCLIREQRDRRGTG